MISLAVWRQFVLAHNPAAVFVTEDGSGKTYGELGDVIAAIGPDMQADVVGVFTAEADFCWYSDSDGTMPEFMA